MSDQPEDPTPPTNHYVLGLVEIDITKGGILECDLPEPGIVRGAFIKWVPKPVLIRRAEPELTPVPVLVIDFDPRKPKRKRRFIALHRGGGIESKFTLQFVAFLVDPNHGEPLVIYEEPLAAEDQLAATEQVDPEADAEPVWNPEQIAAAALAARADRETPAVPVFGAKLELVP